MTTVAHCTPLEETFSSYLISDFHSEERPFRHRAKLQNMAESHAQDILHHRVSAIHEGINQRKQGYKHFTEICWVTPPVPKDEHRPRRIYNLTVEKYEGRIILARKLGMNAFGIALIPVKSQNQRKNSHGI